MSWLCDVCGYENEFNDESQPTTCLCCGEPAPENKIINARRELDAYHREEERKARIEELRRKQELHQQKVDRIIARTTRAVKAIPVVAAVMVLIAFVWIGISFRSEGMTLSAWNAQMRSNIDAISLTGFSEKLRDNLADIGLSEKVSVPINEAGQLVASQMSARFSTISSQNNYLSDNAQTVLENVGNDFKQVGEHMPTISQNITSSCSNMKLNLPVFWSHAKDNVQELINAITKGEGGSDD